MQHDVIHFDGPLGRIQNWKIFGRKEKWGFCQQPVELLPFPEGNYSSDWHLPICVYIHTCITYVYIHNLYFVFLCVLKYNVNVIIFILFCNFKNRCVFEMHHLPHVLLPYSFSLLYGIPGCEYTAFLLIYPFSPLIDLWIAATVCYYRWYYM